MIKVIWCNSFSKRMNGSLVLLLLHCEISNVCNSNLKSSRGGGYRWWLSQIEKLKLRSTFLSLISTRFHYFIVNHLCPYSTME